MTTVLPDNDAKLVPMALIDEPSLAMRQTFNADKLEELIESIRRVGLIQSIAVIQKGARYEIAAGHRRFIACRALGHDRIRARVFPEGTALEQAIKWAENQTREDVNAGEEAEYLKVLLEEQCGGDIEKLRDLMQVGQSYLDTRLSLLRGDARVLAALKGGQINFAVAQELNRFKRDDFRWTALEHAISGGATRGIVSRWRIEWEQYSAMMPPSNGFTVGEGGAPASAATWDPKCVICGDGEPFNLLRFVHVHDGVCMKLFDRAVEPFQPSEKESR